MVTAVRQTGLLARTVEPRGSEDLLWTAWLSWDGAAGIISSAAETLPGVELFVSDRLRPSVLVAAESVELIGGYGPAHLLVEVFPEVHLLRESGVTEPLRDFTRVRRWFEGHPDNELFESIKRELLRASEHPAWEP